MRFSFTLIVAGALAAASAFAQSTAFTYQGRLQDNGVAADGLHDLRFRLFDAATNGNQVGATLCVDNVAVGDGLVTVQLDFAQQYAAPTPRFLEIEARRDTGLDCAGAVGFTLLAPRQQLTATPLANHAKSAFALSASDGSPASAVLVDAAGNVGIGTPTPNKRLSVDGDVEIGISTSDYHHLRIGGGNSDGFLYGSFPRFGDGIHMGYNYFADASGANQIIHPDGGTSRISMQYGAIAFATAPPFSGEPFNRAVIDSAGNMGVGTVAPGSRLDVRGDIRLGSSGQYRATAGEENLRIIRGVVNSDGAILFGSGFTVSHPSTGHYTLTFNTPFAGPATVTATADSQGSDGEKVVMTHGVTGATATLETRLIFLGGGFSDITFHFVAVGPR